MHRLGESGELSLAPEVFHWSRMKISMEKELIREADNFRTCSDFLSSTLAMLAVKEMAQKLN